MSASRSVTKRVFVLGGNGQLGSVVGAAFKAAGYVTIAGDIRKRDSSVYDHTILVGDSPDDGIRVAKEVRAIGKLTTVISVAGGFAMTNAASDDVFAVTDKMLRYNVHSAVLASYVAAHALHSNGTLVLTGAAAARDGGTPAMLGYGASKAATHHIVRSLTNTKAAGLPSGTFVAAIAPKTLDTQTNREAMPKADFSTWTKLETVADLLVAWAEGKQRPGPGDIVDV